MRLGGGKEDRSKGKALRVSEGWGFGNGRVWDDRVIAVGSIFKTNEEAVAFVTRRTAEGSEYHAECLAYALAQRMRA